MNLFWDIYWRVILIVLSFGFSIAGAAGTQSEVTDFGTNPGQLRMYRYIPDGLRGPTPLVVALHGCNQTAVPYAEASGWMQYADRWGFALLIPEQRSDNNSGLCFNWFEPEDTARDTGEALSIRQMIVRMQADYPINPDRIYVTGLSAGGAMTAVLMAAYPEIFSGGAIMAGIPYGCAKGLISGLWCMQFGWDWKPKRWAKAVRRATADLHPPVTRWPRVSIWQGDDDGVVNPENAQELMEQWTQVVGIDQIPDGEDLVKGYPHRVYKDTKGHVLVETYTLTAMGHGVPIAPGEAEDACGRAGDFILPVGICASYYIGQFWGLNTP